MAMVNEILKEFLYGWILPPKMQHLLLFWVLRFFRVKNCVNLKRWHPHAKKLFVLATGPSLKVDYPKYQEDISQNDSVVMNQFVQSSLFDEIRPTAYLLADPLYFMPIETLGAQSREKMVDLRKGLAEKVKWPMKLIVPDSAYGSDLFDAISGNGNISVVYYNSRPATGSRLSLWLMSKNYVSPPAQTVASVAVGLGIVLRYPEVWLLGADTSMHAMMRVDQKTNEMYLEDSHFYGTTRAKSYRDVRGGCSSKASYWLACASRMLAGYERVRELADYCGVRVVNGSSFSWIDSLERPK